MKSENSFNLERIGTTILGEKVAIADSKYV
jgi:hypothetical protein